MPSNILLVCYTLAISTKDKCIYLSYFMLVKKGFDYCPGQNIFLLRGRKRGCMVNVVKGQFNHFNSLASYKYMLPTRVSISLSAE